MSLWSLLSLLFLWMGMGRRVFVRAEGPEVVESLVDRTVSLPCLAAARTHHNIPVLLLYYRADSNFPFFSYDARSGQFWRGGSSRTRDPRYEGRVAVNVTSPHKVALNLHRVTRNDTGKFTCRVDFQGSPSQNSVIDLKVYENPTFGPNITIVHSGDTILTHDKTQGPFHAGEFLNLTCAVTGGFPQPIVTWWKGKNFLDNTSKVILGKSENTVINLLSLGPLTSEMVREPFTCRSKNNPLSEERFDTVLLKIYAAPSSVILDPKLSVQAGERQTLECRAVDSYPEANITWTLNGKPLKTTAMEIVEQQGEDTVSKVQIIPRPEYNGAELTCTAASVTLNDPPVTASIHINVTHAPIVNLTLGANLDPANIRQKDDVYFECKHVSNPPVQKITWYKEGKEVWQRTDAGVLLNGDNLVLQQLQRAHGGNYSCRATNAIGTQESNSVSLSIMYGPVCTQERKTVTAIEGEKVELLCNVDANPPNVTFYWTFNNTVDSTQLRETEYTMEGLASQLSYVAYSAREYGTVFCWAKNVVAAQRNPCVFTLQPAGAPDSVEACVLSNQSAGSFHVACKPGADGGLTQKFRAKVFLAGSDTAVHQRESFTPIFDIEGLAPGEDYTVTVTAVNRRGNSPPISLQAFTLKVAENRMISGVPSSSDPDPVSGVIGNDGLLSTSQGVHQRGGMSPIAGAVAGAVGVIIAIAMAAIVFAKRKCRSNNGSTDLVDGQELDPFNNVDNVGSLTTSNISMGSKQTCSEEIGRTSPRAHQPTITPNSGEMRNSADTEPFLMDGNVPKATIVIAPGKTNTHCGSNVNSGRVFTIPANIPPPPQYCTTPDMTTNKQNYDKSSTPHVHFQGSDEHNSHKTAQSSHFHLNPSNQSHMYQHLAPQNQSNIQTRTGAENNQLHQQMQHPRCCSLSSKSGCPSCCNVAVCETKLGSPQYPIQRTLSPTQHHLMQHHSRIGGSSTPPPRLQHQHSGASTPPQNSSNVQSPVGGPFTYPMTTTSHPLATLPRQRSHEMHPRQNQPKLYHQRSITEDGSQTLGRQHPNFSPLPQMKLSVHNPSRGKVNSNPSTPPTCQTPITQPSELNYITPNAELAMNYGTTPAPTVAPSTGRKVTWEGAPSGAGSDV